MATLPSYVIVRMSGYGEDIIPSVERTEMERGVPKQRRLNSQLIANLRVALLVETTQQSEDFLDWYINDISGGVEFFEMRHPRTGQLINARFPGGDIGSLRSATGTNYMWQRDVVIEYLR